MKKDDCTDILPRHKGCASCEHLHCNWEESPCAECSNNDNWEPVTKSQTDVLGKCRRGELVAR